MEKFSENIQQAVWNHTPENKKRIMRTIIREISNKLVTKKKREKRKWQRTQTDQKCLNNLKQKLKKEISEIKKYLSEMTNVKEPDYFL